MTETHFYEPSRGHRLPHDPFKAIVAPRPIGWISTRDRGGRVNLAPYSFFNAFCDDPPIVGFSSQGRKDSLRNAEESGEFVANLATRALAEAVNLSSAPVARGVDEMAMAGLTPAPCRLVAAPRVGESPAALECKVIRVVRLADMHGEETSNFLVLGQVVGVHIDPAYLKDGLFDMTMARTIARCGYRGDYAEVDHLFEMVRPQSG
ncbi:Flavin reductase like domain protein [Aquisphaera giovannonii]|uniref:Flavin reductase like domain protein n=1 Tax=Aquisphaera giovannonii TaxID=406548 RepID=A0A5B9WD28_9BACT|nr:flavin reductase family protein [Aquisphaera giovannonii]QEH38578.1 Flavin reductase like domain protein [Aquisphaera giovannonii]